MNNISIEVFHEEFIKLFQHDDVLFYPYRQQPIQPADPRKKNENLEIYSDQFPGTRQMWNSLPYLK